MKMSSNLFYAFCRWLSQILLKLMCRLKVIGKENLPQRGGYIIASNHLSYLDPLVVGVGCPRQIYFMARKTLFRNRLFAKLLTSLDVFAVDEQGTSLGAVKESLSRLSQGRVVALFPEGTRSKDGYLKEAKWGVGFLALKSNVPVIPARIIGTDQALPIGAKFVRFRPVRLYFGQSLKFEKDSLAEKQNDYSEISRLIMEKIASLGTRTDESNRS